MKRKPLRSSMGTPATGWFFFRTATTSLCELPDFWRLQAPDLKFMKGSAHLASSHARIGVPQSELQIHCIQLSEVRSRHQVIGSVDRRRNTALVEDIQCQADDVVAVALREKSDGSDQARSLASKFGSGIGNCAEADGRTILASPRLLKGPQCAKHRHIVNPCNQGRLP